MSTLSYDESASVDCTQSITTTIIIIKYFKLKSKYRPRLPLAKVFSQLHANFTASCFYARVYLISCTKLSSPKRYREVRAIIRRWRAW